MSITGARAKLAPVKAKRNESSLAIAPQTGAARICPNAFDCQYMEITVARTSEGACSLIQAMNSGFVTVRSFQNNCQSRQSQGVACNDNREIESRHRQPHGINEGSDQTERIIGAQCAATMSCH